MSTRPRDAVPDPDPRLLASLAPWPWWAARREQIVAAAGAVRANARATGARAVALALRLVTLLALHLLEWTTDSRAEEDPVPPEPQAPAPPTTTTATGTVVRDRRRVVLLPPSDVPSTGQEVDPDPVGTPHTSPAPEHPVRTRRRSARSTAARAAAHALGRSDSLSGPVVADQEAFASLLLNAPWAVSVLLDRPASADELAVVVTAAGGEGDPVADWRLAVQRWARRRAGPADTAVLLADVLTSPGAPAHAVDTALRIGGGAVSALSQQQAVTVLHRCLTLAQVPVDPYRTSSTTQLARDLTVTLLAARPELDSTVTRLLELGRPPAGSMPARLPAALELAALALRERTAQSGAALSRLTVAAGADRERWQEAAALADRPLRRPPVFQRAGVPPAVLSAAVRVLRWAWLPVVVLAVSGAAGFLVPALDRPPAPVEVELAEALAALAAAATVNVFTVSLAATRLPGVVVGTAGVSGPLVGCYAASVLLVVLALWPGTPGASAASAAAGASARGWAATAAVVLFVALLLAVMATFLRRSDPARVTAVHTSSQLLTARSTGRRLGRAQARALALNAALATVPSVVTSLAPVPGEVGTPLTAARQGLLVPSWSRLRRLLGSRAFTDGTRLRLVEGLGTTVHAGDLLGTLLPAAHQSDDPATARRARRALRIRTSTRVEDLARASAALTAFGAQLAQRGDPGTGSRVCSAAVQLVSAHVAAVRTAREAALRRAPTSTRLSPERVGTAPVVPALKGVLDTAVSVHLRAGSGLLDVSDVVVRPLLQAAGTPEGVVVLVLTAAHRHTAPTTSAVALASLLRVAGARAAELRDGGALGMVLDDVQRLSARRDGPEEAVQVASELAAIAARVDPDLGSSAAHRLDELLDRVQTAGAWSAAAQARPLWRVGAAAQLAGDLSAAVAIACRLQRRGLVDDVVTSARQEGVLADEAFRSSLGGDYLGDAAKDALAEYGRMPSWISPPPDWPGRSWMDRP